MIRSGALLVVLAGVPGCASRASAPPAEPACAAAAARPEGLVVAGSGAVLPLGRALAERWRRLHPESRVHVPDSIGSGGAVRALTDGVIDVGLLSRRLSERERGGARIVALARSPLHVTAHPRGAPAALSRSQVVEIFAGRVHAWPDGTPIVPLLREEGDSGYPLLASAWPELHAAMREALRAERFTVCYSDQEMRDALAETEGAIGLLDEGTAYQPGRKLRPIAIAGAPPLVKPLSLLLPARASAEAERFVDFAVAPEERDLLSAGGYLAPESER